MNNNITPIQASTSTEFGNRYIRIPIMMASRINPAPLSCLDCTAISSPVKSEFDRHIYFFFIKSETLIYEFLESYLLAH